MNAINLLTPATAATANMASADTSDSVSVSPMRDDVGVVCMKIRQVATTAVAQPTSFSENMSTGSVIEIQGSPSGNDGDWFPLGRFNFATVGVAESTSQNKYGIEFRNPEALAFGSTNTGAYISACGIVQLMPYMRVRHPALADASLTVTVHEG